MKHRLLWAALFLAAATACDGTPELDARTYALQHVSAYEAARLIEPYVYADREGAPGTLSATSDGLTVRETPDNLDKIARVLEDLDQPRSGLRLHFQLIEADGFDGRDPRIATVEEELREIFQFRGYRLLGEAFVTTSDGSEIRQLLDVGGDAGEWGVSGGVRRTGGVVRLDEITLYGPPGTGLTTTVNVRAGQTVVLGSTPRNRQGGSTLFLTVRAEEVGG